MRTIKNMILKYRQTAHKRPSKIVMHPCNSYWIKHRKFIDNVKVVFDSSVSPYKIYVG